MEQLGERVSIFDSFEKFLNIHIRTGELIPKFNIKFTRALNEILEKCRLNDQVCLIFYFDAFDGEMSYLLRGKEHKTLHQAFMIAIEIENNIKYGLNKSHFSRKFFR